MAGGHNVNILAIDPALVKYNNMTTNRHKYFRWNRRTATVSIVFGLVIPSFIGYLGWSTEGKYNFRGKRRGDTIREF